MRARPALVCALSLSFGGTLSRAESVGRFPDVHGAPSSPSAGPSAAPSPTTSPPPDAPREPSAAPTLEPPRPEPLPAPPTRSGAAELAERGRRFEAENRLTEAIRAYTESIRLDPTNGAVLVALGKLRARLDDLSEAEMLFTTAARFRDVAAEALTERAHLRLREGLETEAMKDLALAVEIDPDAANRLDELASWYVARRAWLPALALFRRAEADLGATESAKRAKIQVRALTLLAGPLDPVGAGAAKDYSWTRRALARLSRR